MCTMQSKLLSARSTAGLAPNHPTRKISSVPTTPNPCSDSGIWIAKSSEKEELDVKTRHLIHHQNTHATSAPDRRSTAHVRFRPLFHTSPIQHESDAQRPTLESFSNTREAGEERTKQASRRFYCPCG